MVEIQHTADRPATKRLTRRQIRFLVGGLVLALVAGYLIWSAAHGATAYYVTIAELAQMPVSGRNVRVTGYVVGESIDWEPSELRLRFDVVDDGGRLAVVYEGPRPDMFRDGAEVVVEGRMGASGLFEARQIILKCPSKYEEAQ